MKERFFIDLFPHDLDKSTKMICIERESQAIFKEKPEGTKRMWFTLDMPLAESLFPGYFLGVIIKAEGESVE